jgi:hypothetical protein
MYIVYWLLHTRKDKPVVPEKVLDQASLLLYAVSVILDERRRRRRRRSLIGD